MFKIISLPSHKLVAVKSEQERLLQVVRKCFECPIGLQELCQPVIAADGHVYDFPEIMSWFQERQRSPLTNQSVSEIVSYSSDFSDLNQYYKPIDGKEVFHKKYPKFDSLMAKLQVKKEALGPDETLSPVDTLLERTLLSLKDYWDALDPQVRIVDEQVKVGYSVTLEGSKRGVQSACLDNGSLRVHVDKETSLGLDLENVSVSDFSQWDVFISRLPDLTSFPEVVFLDIELLEGKMEMTFTTDVGQKFRFNSSTLEKVDIRSIDGLTPEKLRCLLQDTPTMKDSDGFVIKRNVGEKGIVFRRNGLDLVFRSSTLRKLNVPMKESELTTAHVIAMMTYFKAQFPTVEQWPEHYKYQIKFGDPDILMIEIPDGDGASRSIILTSKTLEDLGYASFLKLSAFHIERVLSEMPNKAVLETVDVTYNHLLGKVSLTFKEDSGGAPICFYRHQLRRIGVLKDTYPRYQTLTEAEILTILFQCPRNDTYKDYSFFDHETFYRVVRGVVAVDQPKDEFDVCILRSDLNALIQKDEKKRLDAKVCGGIATKETWANLSRFQKLSNLPDVINRAKALFAKQLVEPDECFGFKYLDDNGQEVYGVVHFSNSDDSTPSVKVYKCADISSAASYEALINTDPVAVIGSDELYYEDMIYLQNQFGYSANRVRKFDDSRPFSYRKGVHFDQVCLSQVKQFEADLRGSYRGHFRVKSLYQERTFKGVVLSIVVASEKVVHARIDATSIQALLKDNGLANATLEARESCIHEYLLDQIKLNASTGLRASQKMGENDSALIWEFSYGSNMQSNRLVPLKKEDTSSSRG